MADFNSWLSPGVLHALGWTLIHSLWQCLVVAALAAVLMAFSRRPAIRYLVAVGALALMLAAPVTTFLVLTKSAVPVQAVLAANPGALALAAPQTPNILPVAALPGAMSSRAIGVLADTPRHFPSPNILPWLVAAWLCGVTLFSLRFAGGFLLLEHRRRRQTTVPGAHILAICREVQRQLGLDRAIRYLECGWLQAPAVIGWLRPTILLPVLVLTGLSEAQLRAVIAHELAHIRRLDGCVNLFQVLVETLLFYHPAMWWLNRRIRAERELCCDEIAVSLTGDRLEYARALTRMAQCKSAPVLAMAANRGPLSERILHILGRKSVGAGQRILGLAGSVLFLIAALAAANALFAIAYPIPAAHASESPKAVLSARQIAGDHVARQALPASAPPATSPVPDQTGGNKAAEGETASADQTQSANDSQPEKLVAPSSDLSRLLPTETLTTPIVVASNDIRAPAMGSNNPSAAPAPPTTDEANAGVAHAMSNPTAMPIKTDSIALQTKAICNNVPNNSVSGRVISSKEIELPGFVCTGHRSVSNSYGFVLCTDNKTAHGTGGIFDAMYCPKIPLLRMYVELENTADAGKMRPGEVVTLGGTVKVMTQNNEDYLVIQNAKFLHNDPLCTFDADKQSVGCTGLIKRR